MSYSDDPAISGWDDDRPFNGLFDVMPGDPGTDRALSDASFVAAVVALEAEVARAQAKHGVIPEAAAEAISRAAGDYSPDLRKLGLQAELSATPIIDIVAQLKESVGDDLARYVHLGLTSQDCVDTAFAKIQAAILDEIGSRIAFTLNRFAMLAEEHASTPMVARTLAQSAAPITFGWKVCGWVEGLVQAAINLARVRESLAVQIGGAVGDLGGFGPHPHLVVADVADALGLQPPHIAWHTERSRVLQTGAAAVQVINACAKIAIDVISMTSPDVGELALGEDPRQAGRGGSSAMPHKRNPAAAILIKSASVQAPGLLATLAASGVQEHERAAGSWQAEWRASRELMHLMGGATLELALLQQDLSVDSERMLQNLLRADVGRDVSAAERRCEEYLARFNDMRRPAD